MRGTRCNHHIELRVLEPESSSWCCKELPRSHRFDRPSSYRNLALIGALNSSRDVNGTHSVRTSERSSKTGGSVGRLTLRLNEIRTVLSNLKSLRNRFDISISNATLATIIRCRFNITNPGEWMGLKWASMN